MNPSRMDGWTTLANYILTDHALKQMQRRDISEEDVKKVITSPEQKFDIREGRCIFQSRLSFEKPTRIYLVRVFVDVDREPKEVVTVYRTSKVEKYWR